VGIVSTNCSINAAWPSRAMFPVDDNKIAACARRKPVHTWCKNWRVWVFRIAGASTRPGSERCTGRRGVCAGKCPH